MDRRANRVSCGRCGDEDVARIHLRSARLDLCRCRACGHEWDQTLDAASMPASAPK